MPSPLIKFYDAEHDKYLVFLTNNFDLPALTIHLAAIRFCMLSIGQAIHRVDGIAEMRKQISANITHIDFATRLWSFFRALIARTLDDLKALLGDAAAHLMEAIELRVQRCASSAA